MLRDKIRAEASDETVDNNEVSVHYDGKQLTDLYGRSYIGLCGICIYLAVSMIAFHFREQSLTGILPSDLMNKLGTVPPVFMAVGLMWVSTISALTVIIGRLYHGTPPSGTTSHVAFRIGFFVLFFLIGGLGQYINEIFISGLVVLTLQHYNVYTYYMQKIEKKFIIGGGLHQEAL
ncbi:MAG: hypothetical protein PHH91_03195 [Desulfuromonadaceae bacterium]|nr:hypothetical protein [Desulfuromonadaceae bacterium]